MTDRENYERVDVQAAPEANRDAVMECLTDHLDAGDVRVVSFGRDPRSILATCDRCETQWWFEHIEEAWIPGTAEDAARKAGESR